ncbi:MAG: sigma-70 family RNA polymerase sigma factor [Rhodothermales bacterium]
MHSAPDVTRLLLQWREGDQEALNQLLHALYQQLRDLAHAHLAGERTNHTLNTTALVHEAYLKLVDIDRIHWRDRAHFLAMASRVMRRILIDYAHRRKAQKRGGGVPRTLFDEEEFMTEAQAETLLELDDVLARLEAVHPRPAQAVELYYIGGLTQQEVAEVVGVSQPTVMRDLQFSQAWLAREWHGDLTRFGRKDG